MEDDVPEIFNSENKVWRFLGKLVDVFVVNLLFVICSLPIVTIVPSCSAMYYVTMKLVRDTENYPARSFLHFFRKNWKQGVVLSVILIVTGVLFAGDIFLYRQYADLIPGSMVLTVLMIALFVVWLFIALYLPAVFARFDNSIKNTLKNSLLMAIAHLPFTLLILLITIVLGILGVFVPILWFGLVAFGNSCVFVKIFDRYMPKEENVTPEQLAENNRPILSDSLEAQKENQ